MLCGEKRRAQRFKWPRGMFLTPCARNILTRFLRISDQLLIPHPYTTLQSDLHIACPTTLYAHDRTPFVLRGLCLFKARPASLQSVSITASAGVPDGAPSVSRFRTPPGCRRQRGSRPRSRGSARKGLADASPESLGAAWSGRGGSEPSHVVQQWSSFTIPHSPPGETHPHHQLA